MKVKSYPARKMHANSPKPLPYFSAPLLLATAGIWGFAFVAQRMGMEHVGPFAFNGIRFLLGAVTLVPVYFLKPGWAVPRLVPKNTRALNKVRNASMLLGLLLFCGASLQQAGIVCTTAGKAGFITGLYVVFVPIIGIFLGRRTGFGTLVGALLAAVGMYFMSMTENLSIEWGDLLVLFGALFWACHVLLISWLVKRTHIIKLAITQYLICSLASIVIALGFETINRDGLAGALAPILYGGIMSVGLAYTLQVVGQKRAHPAHAAIILSLEAVFAALGGWLILGEVMPPRAILGAVIMLSGMLLSQLWNIRHRESKTKRLAPVT